MEETRAAVVLSGRVLPEHWGDGARDRDLWDLRGLAETLVGRLDPDSGSVEPLGDTDAGALALAGTYRPGTLLALRAHGELAGVAGEVMGQALDAPAWAASTFALEVRLTEGMAERRRPRLVPVPTRPASDRDLALLVPDALEASRVAQAIRESAGELLEGLHVFDVYTGQGVPEGIRSIAYRLVFRHPERTLKDVEVDAAVDRVLSKLRDVYGVERRG